MYTTLSFAAAAHFTPYSVYLLNKSDLNNFLTLQNITLEELPDNKKHYLKPRTAEDLQDHLDAGLPIIGIRNIKGEHIAHLLLTDAASPASKNINLEMDDTVKTALIQSLTIHPDYRPSRYNKEKEIIKPDQLLFTQAEIIARTKEFDQIIAKVAIENKGSISLFEQHKFKVMETKQIEGEGYQSHFLRYEVSDQTKSLEVVPLAPPPKNGVPLVHAYA